MLSSLAPVWNIGPQIAGQILGDTYQLFRPTDATNPTDASALLLELPCWITPDKKGKASIPSGYGKPIWYGLFDPTLTQVGDYLIGPLGTFFIASQSVPQPMQVISCNAVCTITQPVNVSGFGAQSNYGGDTRSSEEVIASNWPCSILQGTKGEIGATKLPGDAKMPWSAILLPAIPGVTLRNNLVLTDATGTRYILSSTELSDLGWRCSAMRATT